MATSQEKKTKKAVSGLNNLAQLLKNPPPATAQQDVKIVDKKTSDLITNGLKMDYATIIHNAKAIIDEEEGVLVCVWRALIDLSPRTLIDVSKSLSATDFTLAEIGTALNTLKMQGYLVTRQIPGLNKHPETVYKLVMGTTVPTPQSSIKVKPIMSKAPTFTLDPKSVVTASEGLDVCIWKLMQDLKPRTLDTMGELLKPYGFLPVKTRDRVVSLFKRGWMTKSTFRSKQQYALKKNIPMPLPEVAEEVAPKVGSAPTTKREQVPAMEHSVPNATKIVARFSRQPATCEHPSAEKLIIHPGDAVVVALWKVMADYLPYTANDLKLLLADYGFSESNVSGRLSEMDLKNGWFDVSKQTTGKKLRTYTLRRNIEMPTTVRRGYKEEPAAVSETEQKSLELEGNVPASKLSENEVESEIKKLCTATATPANATRTAASDANSVLNTNVAISNEKAAEALANTVGNTHSSVLDTWNAVASMVAVSNDTTRHEPVNAATAFANAVDVFEGDVLNQLPAAAKPMTRKTLDTIASGQSRLVELSIKILGMEFNLFDTQRIAKSLQELVKQNEAQNTASLVSVVSHVAIRGVEVSHGDAKEILNKLSYFGFGADADSEE